MPYSKFFQYLHVENYEHIDGCKRGEHGCSPGKYCGDIPKCSGSSCSFTKCLDFAKSLNAEGFAYYEGRQCRMCTASQLESHGSSTGWGIYKRIGICTCNITLYIIFN